LDVPLPFAPIVKRLPPETYAMRLAVVEDAAALLSGMSPSAPTAKSAANERDSVNLFTAQTPTDRCSSPR
jgi:hypothetical protein